MALPTIPPDRPQALTQTMTQLTDNTKTVVIAAVSGQSINIYSLIADTDTTCTLTLRHENAETLFPLHLTSGGGVSFPGNGQTPIFKLPVGASLTIQSSESSLNAAIYIQYAQK